MKATLECLKALSDETRLRIVCVLARHELNVNELVSLLDMGQSRISRHLKILANAGLLIWRRDGLWIFYSVPVAGVGKNFLDALLPFIEPDKQLHDDLTHAKHILEERIVKTRQFFNSIAEDWDALNIEILGDFDLPAKVLQAFESIKVANSCIVDVGCGTGAVLEVLRNKAKESIGVDGSPRMLEFARKRFADDPSVSLRIGELEHLPLSDGEADFVCINMVLHHLSDPKSAFKEIWRVLKKGGKLFVSDFDQHVSEKMREEYGDRWLGFSKDVLSSLITDAQLHVCEWQQQPVQKGLQLHLVIVEKK